MNALETISPIDGRYQTKTNFLSAYFSEYALMKYRLMVEIEYFLLLAEKKFFKLKSGQVAGIRQIIQAFDILEAQRIKDIEKTTNHDVKAVEYYLKEKIAKMGLQEETEWIHFGLTSQDINNAAIPMMWKDSLEREYIPTLTKLKKRLEKLAGLWQHVPMLAHTHGQPASPTRLGKEIMVFAERLEDQILLFKSIPFSGKFGGATGNFNAHYVAFPRYNWKKFADELMEKKLGIKRQQYTTQIEHYDHLASHFDAIKRINNILTDLCRDLWQYISMEYFTQKTREHETGSSAMPHKVNPIDFENAEGNLGMANAILEHLSAKLPISRLQRDLTDSTVIRNIGVPLAHSFIALRSIETGLEKIVLNPASLSKDLENNWAVVAEAIQTILRRERYPQPYEALKKLTRGKAINQKSLHNFIDQLKVSSSLKAELKKITPHNYTGI